MARRTCVDGARRRSSTERSIKSVDSIPTARRYTYQVNSRFGSTSPATTTFRTPFRITLDISMQLGHNADEQSVVLNMRIKPPLVGTRATADTIKNRYMGSTSSNGFSDIYKLMLRFADSLALTRER